MRQFRFEPKAEKESRLNAYWLGVFSRLAYQDSPTVQRELNKLGLEMCAFFDQGGTTCFLARSEKAFFLVFRGTNEMKDWFDNFGIAKIEAYHGKCHAGFDTALQRVWADLLSSLGYNISTRRLWICGHSLGGGLASHAAARFDDLGFDVQGVYTFGAPRVGNKAFCKAIRNVHRYVNNNDAVPRIPPPWLGYRHPGICHYFTEQGYRADDIGWFSRLCDRMHGRMRDLFRPGTDGIKDHRIDEYINNLVKSLPGKKEAITDDSVMLECES